MTLNEVHVEGFFSQLSHESLVPTVTKSLSVQFRKRAHETVEFICDYYARVDDLPVRASVEVLFTPCRHALTATYAHMPKFPVACTVHCTLARLLKTHL